MDPPLLLLPKRQLALFEPPTMEYAEQFVALTMALSPIRTPP